MAAAMAVAMLGEGGCRADPGRARTGRRRRRSGWR